MRTLMTLLTLGAGGAGYLYLQQPPTLGDTFHPRTTSGPLFQPNRTAASLPAGGRPQMKDLVSRIHEHTRSVFEEFTDRHGGHSDAPGEDAFQRLRQVAQSLSTDESPGDRPADSTVERVRQTSLPALNELQRVAFHTVEVPLDDDEELVTPFSVVNSLSLPAQSGETVSRTNQPVADEPATSPIKTTTLPSEQNVTKADTTVSNVSRSSSTSNIDEEPQSKDDSIRLSRPQKNLFLDVEWKVIGKTTEGRPMHSLQLGDVGTRTLVIAGLNGEDRTAVRWLEMLADDAKQHPDLMKTNQIVFIRAANPDGLVKRVANNSHGISLNQNFPPRQFRSNGIAPQFPSPTGEAETRVILEVLSSFRPRRVIHLTSTSGQSVAICNRSATRLADELQRSMKISVQQLDPNRSARSLEDFADGTLDAASLTIRLSAGNSWKAAWEQSRETILGAVVALPVEAIRGEVDSKVDPNKTTLPNMNIEPVSQKPKRRGYEEVRAPTQ